MPIVFLIVGLMLLAAAVNNKQRELGELWSTQFSGPGSFTAWALAFLLLAAIGTIDVLKPMSRALMGLLLLVMILVNSRDVDLITLIQAQIMGRAFASGRVAN